MLNCPDCEKVNEKFAALRAYVFGKYPNSCIFALKCPCSLFATRAVTVNHPVGGQSLFFLCEDCQPPRHAFDQDKEQIEVTDLNEHSAWARWVNDQLK